MQDQTSTSPLDGVRVLDFSIMLAGPYCATCGQKAHIHRSVRGFMQDFLQGLFNFEGKFWHTLPMLVWRPGEMTRRYIAGERARSNPWRARQTATAIRTRRTA